MKRLLHIVTLMLLTVVSYGQFTQPGHDIKIPKTSDSLLKSNPSDITLDMKLYNQAYDAYLKKLQNKQRNQIIIQNTGVSFTQTAFDNWAAGGNNSYSIRGVANIIHNYVAPVFNVTSTFNGAMSFVYSDNKLRKSEDFFNIAVTPGWKIAERWQMSSSMVLRSQFANSFRDVIMWDTVTVSQKSASFFAPANLTLSVGVTYVSKNGKLKVYIAPISGNMTIILDKELADRGGLGLPVGDRFGNTFGAFMRVNYGTEFAKKKMAYTTKLESFWGYNDLPEFTWEHWLSFKFTSLLSANLYVKTYYNNKILTPRFYSGTRGFWGDLQMQETFTFGLSYNFTGKAPNPAPIVSDNKYLKASPKKKGRRTEQ